MHQLKDKYHLNGPRLYDCPIPIVGLSGSIATGKSTVAKILEDTGFNVICADSLIHDIYREKDTLDLLKKNAPHIVKDQEIDFKSLRQLFFTDLKLKERLEAHLYARLPLLFNQRLGEHKVVIYDVPLLYEKKLENLHDLHGIVYTKKELQLERLKKRDQGYSVDSLEKVLSNQIPIENKKEKAQFVIDNNLGFEELKKEVRDFVNKYFLID